MKAGESGAEIVPFLFGCGSESGTLRRGKGWRVRGQKSCSRFFTHSCNCGFGCIHGHSRGCSRAQDASWRHSILAVLSFLNVGSRMRNIRERLELGRGAFAAGKERPDSFETFCSKMLLVAKQYPGGVALIPSMAERTEKVQAGMNRCQARTHDPAQLFVHNSKMDFFKVRGWSIGQPRTLISTFFKVA